MRARFLAFRAISQASTLAGFAFGGLALQTGKSSGWLLAAFAAIFLIGSSCRFMSAWFLSQHSEPSRGRYSMRQVPLREVFFRSRKTGGGTPIVLYLLAMQAAVQISGPDCALHARPTRDELFELYGPRGSGLFGQSHRVAALGSSGALRRATAALDIGGTSIVPIAALWLGSDFFANWQTSHVLEAGLVTIPVNLSAEFVYIGLIQLISGIVWAAYELACC